MAALSTKSTEQSRAYESRVAGLEEALLDKRRMEEQLSQARDDLGHQVKRLEIQLNEKDSTVQVGWLQTLIQDLAQNGLLSTLES